MRRGFGMRMDASDCSDQRRRQRFLFAFTIVLLCGCGSQAHSGRKDGVCVSQGGRFPKFSLEGQSPRKASKGAIDLTLCRYYRKNTCCDIVQTHAALVSLQKLAAGGEASSQCLEKWEVLECSICNPRVGVSPGPPLLCPSFCESVFSACGGAFFSTDPLSQVLMPCGPKDILCAKAAEWASNSSTFCQLAGFSVVDAGDKFHSLEERVCFDGKAEATGSMDEVVDIKRRSARRMRHYKSMDMLKNYMDNMDVAVKIMWAIGGLVLTAGALHLRRRSLSKRNAAAVVLRNKLQQEEARSRQQALYKFSPTSSGTGVKRDKKLRDSPKAG